MKSGLLRTGRRNTSSGNFSVIYREEGCSPVIIDPLIDKKPAVWFVDKQLCLVETGKIVPQRLLFEGNVLLPETFTPKYSVSLKSGEILLSDNTGIIQVDLYNRPARSTFRAKWVPVEDCQAMAADKYGRVFAFSQGIIYRYSGPGKMIKLFDTGIKEMMKMFIDSKGNFWLTGSEVSKHYKYDGRSLRQLIFHYYNGKHVDPVISHIRSVFEDSYQNIWFGTDGDGALLYSPGKVKFLRSDIGFTRCLAWFNNELWAGTFNAGLWRISPDLSRARRVNSSADREKVYYLDLAADNNGRLWIASRHGLEVVDHAGRSLFRYPYSSQTAKLMVHSHDTIMLFCDNRLHRFYSGRVISWLSSVDFAGVSSFLYTKDTLWVGSQFGIYRCATSAGFDRNRLFSARNKLSASGIYALLLHKGSIWAATGNGIEIFAMDGTRKTLPANVAELQNEVIYALMADEQGRIWFSGNHGLGCINYDNDRSICFPAQNNLQSPEFNYNAACRSPGGNLYFGGIQGINGFDPAWFNPVKKNPGVRLLSLFISDSAYTNGMPPVNTQVELNRKAPHISGKVFCSDYTNAGTRLFSFYLEGSRQVWSKPSTGNDFSYRDLPPGKYRLLVKSSDPLQNWSEPVTLITISISPPFWETGWFLFLSAFLITTITALVVRYINAARYTRRIHALEQQNAIENERLRISKDMHDDLGASLTRISILSELAKKQQGDPARSQQIISQISDISGGVVDDLSEIIWAMNPRNDSLDSFTSYIRQYMSTYLESAEINCRFIFPEETPGYQMSSELRRNLFLTVKEALHNVVKHSNAANVQMEIKIDGQKLHITLADDGKGFKADNMRIGGNGLINMRKRIEDNGGLFNLITDVEKGTKIELSVRLHGWKKSH